MVDRAFLTPEIILMENQNSLPEPVKVKTPWKDIWFSPASVTHRIFKTTGENRVHRLMMIRGLLAIAALRSPFWVQNAPDPLEVAILVFIIGPITGLFFSYALSGALGSLVRKFSGQNVLNVSLRIGIAWSFLPVIAGTVVFIILCFALFPETLPLPKPPFDYYSVGLGLVFVAVGMLYSFFLRVVMTAEISGISRIASLWLNVLALLITGLPIAGIIYVYAVMIGQILDFSA